MGGIKKRIYTRPVTFGGPTDEGSPHFKFKKDIKIAFTGVACFDEEDISIEIELYLLKKKIRPGMNDLDNFIKPIIDALDEEKIIQEHQMGFISIKRIIVSDPNEEGIQVTIK